MKHLLLIVGFVSSANAAECDLSADYVKVEYKITKTPTLRASRDTQLTLWRQGENRVAHQYQQTEVTEAWEFLNKKMIKPTRYFDKHERAIEYQPGEKVHGKSETDWSHRYQLIANQLLSQTTVTKSYQSGCYTMESRELKRPKSVLTVEWNKSLNLVERLTIRSTKLKETWQLKAVTQNKSEIDAFFTALDDYQSTDFADVGDDHTDPFLTQMVTLGFIEHGASGFYDQQGNSLGYGHRH